MFLDSEVSELIEKYSEFTRELVWFRTFCIGKAGKNLDDYVRGYKALRLSFDGLLKVSRTSYYIDRDKFKVATGLIARIESILSADKVRYDDIGQVGKLIMDFEIKGEGEFRREWLEACAAAYRQRDPIDQKLYESVADLVKSHQYDAAVVAAFKFLENQLQRALKIPPHEYYGERLINHAFAPGSGKLQLGTSESEQQGLRNLFSGAYALFRNPSAHRSVQYSEFSASAIISMAMLLNKMIYSMKKRKSRTRKSS